LKVAVYVDVEAKVGLRYVNLRRVDWWPQMMVAAVDTDSLVVGSFQRLVLRLRSEVQEASEVETVDVDAEVFVPEERKPQIRGCLVYIGWNIAVDYVQM
jgi:uncharacterized membrane protein